MMDSTCNSPVVAVSYVTSSDSEVATLLMIHHIEAPAAACHNKCQPPALSVSHDGNCNCGKQRTEESRDLNIVSNCIYHLTRPPDSSLPAS